MANYSKISDLFDANPYILRILVNSDTLDQARRDLFDYLNKCEKDVCEINCPLHPLEIKNARQCIQVFKNIISPINEAKTNHSCLNSLWRLATEHWRKKDWSEISDAFLVDMKHLFKGVIGLSGIYSKSGICKREVPSFVHMEGREAAIVRSNLLNDKVASYKYFIEKNNYKSGLETDVVERRVDNKSKILKLLDANEQDWCDYKWHLNNVFTSWEKISQIVELSEEDILCVKQACKNRIPFGITPYYLSLFDPKDNEGIKYDKCLRDHVIPNQQYLDNYLSQTSSDKDMLDFMHEKDTSPIDLVTRRYPLISIFKPYNTCSQICVYCQRNWELVNVKDEFAHAAKNKIERAISWFRNNQNVEEVLITGGDPLVLDDEKIDFILAAFSAIPHIKRIRIGSRVPVTVPFRITDNMLNILDKYHDPPRRTISIMTHIQNAYEISTELAGVVDRIKKLGIDVYNQQVFTLQNCRKFETCYLRENLKMIGITPYYLFNLKGKNETKYFRVPLARLLQENKEEARLLPGILRTDRAVFNVPKLGKNNLVSWQDHDYIMMLDNGSRIYEFYPWEKYMAPVDTFLFQDEPIYDFLERMENLGEDLDDYKTIWYYY